MEITTREIIFSIVIVCVMIVVGLCIANVINDNMMEQHQQYHTAVKINDDKELFEYSMRTNVGNAFVYGELKAVDTVTYPEIGDEYVYIKKVKEQYTRHTRTVTKTRTVNGKQQSYVATEYYWKWDAVDSWEQHSDKISFIGVEFDYGTVAFPEAQQIAIQKESSQIRYVYYGTAATFTGTIYATLSDKTINDAKFYDRLTIEETVNFLTSKIGLALFWIVWLIITAALVYGFYKLENRWLEDR